MEDLLYWVWLSRLFPYGSDKPRELLRHFEGAKGVYEAGLSKLRETGILTEKELDIIRHTSLSRAQQILSDCRKERIKVVPYHSENYPARLRNIYAPPMVFYLKGDLGEIDREPAITVVGTRKASEYGLSITGNLSYELAKSGITIISGCAVGIDEFAHKGALKAGGRTIAVLGCGLDVDYPRANRELKQEILKRGGVLLSELPPGEGTSSWIFPVRNRLMSALSLGVLVTEAPVKSGALITAEHAVEQGKDLFCVPPHDIYSSQYSGVVKYLREGAIPVFSYQDILLEYALREPEFFCADDILKQMWEKSAKEAVKSQKKSPEQKSVEQKPEEAKPQIPDWEQEYSLEHQKIFELLTDTPQFIDNIVINSKLPMPQVMALLTELEIAGLVVSHSGGRYAKV